MDCQLYCYKSKTEGGFPLMESELHEGIGRQAACNKELRRRYGLRPDPFGDREIAQIQFHHSHHLPYILVSPGDFEGKVRRLAHFLWGKRLYWCREGNEISDWLIAEGMLRAVYMILYYR